MASDVPSPAAGSKLENRRQVPAEVLADHLETPALDDRSYRVIRLPNKLEALLVHDPDTDKASAALDVNVGNFSDRDDMPGMAHAVEHLLFMGTEKYPKENAYSQYLTSRSGHSNAYTASTSTNYYFEVAASAGTGGDGTEKEAATGASPSEGVPETESPLYGALDRFAQFFIAPLFLPSTLDRELRAVDSENKKNLQNDQWRLHQLSKSLSNPKHPFCHFSTGSLDTLRDKPRERGVEVRSQFIKFHEEHYSANRMKLVILGRETLDVLESWVGQLFAGVRNKDLPQNRWDGIQPLTEKELQTQYFAKPVMDFRSLDLTFPFPDEEKLYESQPSRYLSHLIGHEGPGSILAYIKAKGWANGLSAGNSSICPGSALFSISIRLTEEGLKQYKEIVKVIFQYISLLNETEPQAWIVEEMKGMAEVDFRFRQKSPASKFTSRISAVMQKPLPREWLLSGSSLIRKFDPAAISEGLAHLRPDNFRMSIVSQDLSDGLTEREKWYGTEYRSEKIPAEDMAEIKKAAASTKGTRPEALHLPHRNEFIPTRLEVDKRQPQEPLKLPKLIRNDEGVRLWWKKDDRFWVPKGTVLITLRNPLANATSENWVKTKLYCELVNDALVEYSYDAELAGLNYGLGGHSLGLDVEVSGYNDKMPVLLEKVLLVMRDLEVKPDRFKVVKERLLRGYRNWDYSQPYHQVGDYTKWLNSENGWINEQNLAELPHLQEDDVRQYYPLLLRRLHIETLVHGNLYKEDALKLTRLIETILKPRALAHSQWPIRRALVLPKGGNFTYERTLKDPANVNHCIEYFLSVGESTERALRARLQLFAQTTDEPAFDTLRTKEQLGYVVFTGVRVQTTVMGYRVIIQSERSPEYLEKRIDSFLRGFDKVLQDMTADEFEGHKRSLINQRLEKLKNLSQETQRFWNHISTEYYDFEQVDLDVAELRQVTKADLILFYKSYIDPAAPGRTKLAIHMLAQSSSVEIAKHTSPEEQEQKVLRLLGQYLNSQGIAVDQEALQVKFEEIDVAKRDRSTIITVVTKYLADDLKIDAAKVKTVIDEGSKLLETVLPSLGIDVASEAAAGTPAAEPKTDPIETKAGAAGAEQVGKKLPKPAVFIEDVRDFKASLAVSAGIRPLKDLSEYEDNESKL